MKPMLRTLVLFVLIFVAVVTPAFAQSPSASDDDVNAIAKKLYCPVCENIPLDTCGTAACIQWREEIRDQLNDGKTEQQIIDDFVGRFGERVVGTPQDPILRNLSLLTPWIMAAIVLGIAIYALSRWLSSRQVDFAVSTPTGDSPSSDSPNTAEEKYRSRLEQDLQQRY